MAIDKAGNVIVAGAMKGTVDFGGGPITSPPNGAYFVTKMDAGGKHLWTKLFGESTDQSISVNTDADGNVLIACSSSAKIDFGGGFLYGAGSSDVFIAKLSNDGDHLWSNVFGDAGYDRVSSIGVSSQNTIVIAGDFSGTITFGAETLTNNDNFTDIFTAGLTSNGSIAWAKNYSCTASLGAVRMALRTDDTIILGGVFFGKEVSFGGGALPSAGGTEIYVAALDPMGKHIWSKRFGGPDTQALLGLAVDPLGNVLLGGHFNAPFDLGGTTLPFMGGSDAFVAKLGTSGEHLWSKRFGDAAVQSTMVIAADAIGNVLIGGTMSGTVDFGGGPLTANDQDISLVALRPDGAHAWSRRYGGSDTQEINAAVVDNTGNVLIAGNLKGYLNFGGAPLTSAGLTDIFIAKLAYP
ncbi:MAG: hypothetical protein HUU21_15925 [Polyangiaceae bacterium]|nr:hypothetical protein [Polyangiaceae bacterium]